MMQSKGVKKRRSVNFAAEGTDTRVTIRDRKGGLQSRAL